MSRATRWLVGILIVLSLAGCASTVWVRPGSGPAEFERDWAGCKFDAMRAADPIFATLYLGDCMRGRGWVSERR